ncbi:MAG TPA: 3'-5' exonuclease [Lacunisphaera sp.]|jgi:DNA polymerase-3 subunit epsilon|nr:3'-5' exonuclease [Lacunisphaera sp.]
MVSDTPIHFIDFEGNAESGILEFGVVTLHGGEVVETRTRLCQPTGRIRAEDSRVHGLSEPDLWDAAPFNEEWEYFAGLRQTGPLAAHFASVENHLLRSVWDYPRSAPDFARPGASIAEWGPWIDTGRLYPQFFPQIGESKLERLVAATGLQAELDVLAARHAPAERRRYHAALYDALAGALLLRVLLQRAEFAGATLPWLLQMSALNAGRRQDLQQGELL